jgi:hypothetical protein
LSRFNITAQVANGEQLVHTVWMQRDSTVIGPRSLQALTDKVRDQWSSTILGGTGLPGGIAARLYTQTKYIKVSGYTVNEQGRATEQAESQFANQPSGGAAAALPAQTALVVTLLTNQPGRSGRGRLYLGGLGVSNLDATGLVTAANTLLIANALAGFYVRLRDNVADDDSHRPVVVSPTTGAANKIIRVQVGNVPDTMRSRRASLLESRSSSDVDV